MTRNIDKLPENERLCPISGRFPFCCTSETYRKSCAKLRHRLFIQAGWNFDGCNIKIIQPIVAKNPQKKKKTEEKSMTVSPAQETKKKKKSVIPATKPAKTRFGTCEICGEKKMVRPHNGKMACSMCVNMRCVAKKHPDAVISTLKEFALSAGIIGVEKSISGALLVEKTHADGELLLNNDLMSNIAALRHDLKIYGDLLRQKNK